MCALFTDVVREHESRLGFTPTIDFHGPIDAAVEWRVPLPRRGERG